MYHSIPGGIKVGLIVAMALALSMLTGGRVEGHGGDATLIHSCRNANGNFKIVDANATCQPGRTPLDWDAAATLGGQLASIYARRDTPNSFTGGNQTITGGNVGIGTADPESILNIVKTSGEFSINLGTASQGSARSLFRLGVSPNSVAFIDSNNGNGGTDLPIGFLIQGIEKMRLSSTGNVGIGTTSPTTKLHINDTTPSSTVFRVSGSTTSLADFNVGNNFATWFSSLGAITQNGENQISSHTGFPITFNMNGNRGTYTQGTEVMRITPTGNVGIGTTAPVEKLMVAGNVHIGPQNGLSLIFGGPPELAKITSIIDVGKRALGFHTTGDFGITTPERMRITGEGNVGIGTTSPTAKLDVAGSIKSTMWAVSKPITYAGSAYPRSGTFTSNGGTLMIFASATAFNTVAGFPVQVDVKLDAIVRGSLKKHENEAFQHNTLNSDVIVLTGIGAGSHTVELVLVAGSSDANDYSQVTVLELPF